MIYETATSALRSIFDSRVSGPSTFEPAASYFPASQRFISAFEEIRAEAMAIGGQIERAPRFHDLMPEQAAISANDGRDWRMFILMAYGLEVDQNIKACPTLARLVRETPDVLSAAISFLAPRKVIPPHKGPFKGILRFHLMLSMPLTERQMPAAVLTVDGQDYLLKEGEALLWDDTYEHEVRNESDEMRAALLLDVWRPKMPIDMRILSKLVVAGVRSGMRLRGVSFTA